VVHAVVSQQIAGYITVTCSSQASRVVGHAAAAAVPGTAPARDVEILAGGGVGAGLGTFWRWQLATGNCACACASTCAFGPRGNDS
jgi:hypothetical protein